MPTSPLEPTSALEPPPIFSHPLASAVRPPRQYVNDILLFGNDVEFSGKHKGVFKRSFSKKDLSEAAYVLKDHGCRLEGGE